MNAKRRTAILLSAISVVLVLPAAAQALTVPFTTTPTDTSSPPGDRVGKLTIRRADGTPSVCSASVVAAPNRSTLVTAGHCAFSGFRGGLAQSATFAPGLSGGSAPNGVFTSRKIAVAAPWVLSGHSHYDLAFIVVGRNRRGKAVEDVVGANPIAFNQPRNQAYRIFGYPAAAPFDGYTSWTCNTHWGGDQYDPDPDEQYGPPIMVAGCNMTDGASGGPWLTADGTVASVYTTVTSNPNVRGGPYLGDEASALFDSVKNISTRRCKKSKDGKKSAVTAKKRCKKNKKRS